MRWHIAECAGVQSLEADNRRLQQDSDVLRQQLSSARQLASNNDRLARIQQQLSAKINELYLVNDSLADLVTSASPQ